MFFAPSKSRWRAKIWNVDVSKTGDHIQIKIKMSNPSQEPLTPTKALNQDLKDMDILCTIKIKIESQNPEHGASKTSVYIQIKIKMLDPSQVPPATSRVPNQDF